MELFKMSLSAAAIIITIMVIRTLGTHRLPKKTFLVLWGLVICRLLCPFSIPFRWSAYSLLNGIIKGAKPSLFSANTPNPGEIMASANVTDNWLNSPPIIIVWLVGMVICLSYIIVTHLKCCREYKTALPIENDFIKAWLAEHTLRRTIVIRQSDKILTPLTYGLWQPVILLPKVMDMSNESQLAYVLVHEFTHIKRFDVLFKWALAIALSVHWFNPLVWVMYLLANRDLELSCDETVVLTFGEIMKASYAMALIGLEERKIGKSPICSNFSTNSIQERITSIMKFKKASIFSVVLAVALVTGTTTVFATSDSAPKTPVKVGEVKWTMTVNGESTGGINDGDVKWVETVDGGNTGGTVSYSLTPKSDGDDSAADIDIIPFPYTDEEMKQYIADIESGKIKPLDIGKLPANASVYTIGSNGDKIIVKEAK